MHIYGERLSQKAKYIQEEQSSKIWIGTIMMIHLQQTPAIEEACTPTVINKEDNTSQNEVGTLDGSVFADDLQPTTSQKQANYLDEGNIGNYNT